MAVQKMKLTPFGKKVKKRLIDMGMTQTELAALLGVNKVYVTMILYGQRSGKKYQGEIMRILGIHEAA